MSTAPPMGGPGANTVVWLFRVMFRAEDTSALYARRSSSERLDPSTENQELPLAQKLVLVLWAAYIRVLVKLVKSHPRTPQIPSTQHSTAIMHPHVLPSPRMSQSLNESEGPVHEHCGPRPELWVVSVLFLGLSYRNWGKVASSHARYHPK